MARTARQTIRLDIDTEVEIIAAVGYTHYDAPWGDAQFGTRGGISYYRAAEARSDIKRAEEYIVRFAGREIGALVKWDTGGWGFQEWRKTEPHPEHGRPVRNIIRHLTATRRQCLAAAVGVHP